MYHLVATFFVEVDAERNQRRYRTLLEEQYRIAYISQGAMSFFDAGCLSTEDRKAVVDIIVDIKKQEKAELEKARKGTGEYQPPNVNLSQIRTPSRFSSLNKNWSNPRPNLPRR